MLYLCGNRRLLNNSVALALDLDLKSKIFKCLFGFLNSIILNARYRYLQVCKLAFVILREDPHIRQNV